MDKNREDARKDLQKKVEKLPIKAQQAIAWSLNHWNLVRWMCEKNDTTNKEIEKMKVEAHRKEDYLLLLLLCASQVFQGNVETSE
jgi:hypothetical protein